jgi:uncharacterized membrane-anchored protein YitT (DUF2179 family)
MNKYDLMKKYSVVTVAAVLYAVGVGIFLNPNRLAPGGVSGLSMILKSLVPFKISLGTWILLLNIPILVVGKWEFGFRFLISTIYSIILSSVLIDWIPIIMNNPKISENLMLNAVMGGAIMGSAMGIMFRMETTTGGSDILVKIIRQYRPDVKSGQIFLLVDGLVLILSVIAFRRIEIALFSGIAIYVSSVLLNKTLYGSDESVLFYIISKKSEELVKELLEKENAGVTILDAKGAYFGKRTEMIFCVVRKIHFAKVKQLMKQIDPKAFVIVMKAEQVFGEGFQDPLKPEK